MKFSLSLLIITLLINNTTWTADKPKGVLLIFIQGKEVYNSRKGKKPDPKVFESIPHYYDGAQGLEAKESPQPSRRNSPVGGLKTNTETITT